MRRALLVLLLAGAAGRGWADDRADGSKFEALAEGRSLAWSYSGQEAYGLERYFPGRRVLWLNTATQECQEGKWSVEGPPSDPAICFVYEGDPLPHCWLVWHKGDLLRAVPAQGGAAITSRLGPEHDTPFGCEFVGF